ncbi:MAG: hypothetical protein AAF348_01250 [Bacteroidota bacterium]
MDIKHVKYELQNILSGKNGPSYDALIQTVANHLRSRQEAGPMAEEKHQNKTAEAKKLIEYAQKHKLLIDNVDEDKFISSGAEQKVFVKDEYNVLRLNDAIYYASWKDYFQNLLLNNYFFSDTAYQLLGFHQNEKALFAVVQQPFVKADNLTDLSQVHAFLTANGFENTRNHDYYHPELGVILEDLHDENVLTKNELLYFIDTVFYVEPKIFWK